MKHHALGLPLMFLLISVQAVMISRMSGQWSQDPVLNNAICTAPNFQFSGGIVTDGAGGPIIASQDTRGHIDSADFYAQRVDAAGVVRWANDGVRILPAAFFQGPPLIVSDGAGGMIITWEDYRNGATI